MKFVDERLNKYFWRHEVRCPCGCGQSAIDVTQLQRITSIRAYFGKPLNITEGGGFRCWAYNQSLRNPRPGSLHLSGRATDHWVQDVSIEELHAAWLKKFPDGGIGFYSERHFVHYDSRGFAARW